jgi:hypothetical protein
VKTNKQNISEGLLVKYLLGEATGTEKKDVQAWLNENGDNKKRFYELKLICDHSEIPATANTINENDAWARFKQRTEQANGTRKAMPITSTKRYKWLRVAAILLLLAGGGWLAWLMEGKKPGVLIAAVKTELPGTKVNNTKVISTDTASSLIDKVSHTEIKATRPVAQLIRHKRLLKRAVVSEQKTNENLSAGVFYEDCHDNYVYHGPKYDSNFDN